MANTPDPPDRTAAFAAEPSASEGPPVLSSRDLLAGRREVIIQHGDEQYRLRLTRNDRLILVK